MENATKALLMAGGVLIAIIIISLLVRTYGNMGQFQKQQLTAEEAEKLEAYNKEYTKYLNQYVYGTEVITVINKTLDYQEKQNIEVTVNISFIEPYTYKRKNKTHTTKRITLKKDGDKYEFMDFTKNNINITNSDNQDIKNRAFKCTSIGYDNTTGRVNKIEFVEKMYNGGTAI